MNGYKSQHLSLLLLLLLSTSSYISIILGKRLDSPTTTATATIKTPLIISDDLYEHISDETVFQSPWRSIIRRKVRSPSGHVADYDILDQRGSGAVVIFAWNSTNKTATLIREYMPASKSVYFGVAAGLVENKHENHAFIAAQHELEEECYLTGGIWHSLLNNNHENENVTSTTTVTMDKYCTTELCPYLVMDAEKVCSSESKPRDLEEDMEVVEGIDVDTLWMIIRSGKMNCISSWACLLALQKLTELGEI